VVDAELSVSQQRALAAKAANSTLGCGRQSIASRGSEVILPLCSVLLKPIWNAMSSGGLPSKIRGGHTGASPAKRDKGD